MFSEHLNAQGEESGQPGCIHWIIRKMTGSLTGIRVIEASSILTVKAKKSGYLSIDKNCLSAAAKLGDIPAMVPIEFTGFSGVRVLGRPLRLTASVRGFQHFRIHT